MAGPGYEFWRVFKLSLNLYALCPKYKTLMTEKAMAPHSSTLAWKIPRTEEPGGPRGRKESDTTERLHFHLLYTGKHG